MKQETSEKIMSQTRRRENMNRIYEDDEFQAYKEGIALDILNVDEVRKEKDSLMSGIGNELEKLEQWKREREQRKQ